MTTVFGVRPQMAGGKFAAKPETPIVPRERVYGKPKPAPLPAILITQDDLRRAREDGYCAGYRAGHLAALVELTRAAPGPAVETGRPVKMMAEIAAEVAQKHSVTLMEMKGHRRSRHIVLARQEFFYRCREETGQSYTSIGKFLGGKDHTTALHGAKRHEMRVRRACAQTVDSPETGG